MQQLAEFVANHTLLVMALAGVGGLLVWNLFSGLISGVENKPPMAATQLVNHQDALILDVREDSEYAEGHILNSMHIPLGSLKGRLGQLEKHRERPIIIGCRSGNRSAHACRVLKQNGFTQVYNLQGGMLAWQNANLPIVRGKR
jgi:rhodanese-related sulfurtransferase